MSTLQHCVAVLAVAIGAAGAARAETIDFDEFTEPFQGVESFASGSLSFSSDSAYLGVDIAAPNVGAYNGTPYLIDSRGTLSFARTDGQAFRLLGFEMGQSWFTVQPTVSLTVNYTLADGGSTSQELVLTQERAYSSFAPRLDVTGVSFELDSAALGGGYVGLDNITIAAVPEPASWAGFAAGLLLLGALQRRRVG